MKQAKKIKKPFLLLMLIWVCSDGFRNYLFAQETIQQYLSGTDKDHLVIWDFYCTKGRNSGKWTTIRVPSNWEQQDFGAYTYGHDKVKSDEEGLYKYRFRMLKQWTNKKIFIVFEGSMTDTEVKINGKSAGPIHQGGFYRFKYDISSLLKYDSDNLLEVKVGKMSANASVNNAERNGDFWTLGGIYRPVYLEIVPGSYIDRIAIDAKANGAFSMEVFAANIDNTYAIEASVQKLNGQHVGSYFSATGSTTNKITLTNQFSNPLLWSPEFPNLYQVVVSLKEHKRIVHTITRRFGFRTVELRLQDGLYINGSKIMFKGVNRHSLWPESGRTLSKEISLLDINLMKDMNMNAVRMSHYPPDQHFLDQCDSLGLFVLDELTGWQAAYDTTIAHKLVKELVVRDVNHPSVVIWDNGNEGGWNRAVDNDFWLYDPQHRLVIHPWEKFNGTDTKHYPNYDYVVNATSKGKEVFFPTEFMHGLYDGGAGAGLDDFWNLLLEHPHAAGGFIWAFHDEGIMRRDKSDTIDTDGNHAPDGIVGPHREKEASFYTIKEIWSPIYIEKKSITSSFDGKLQLQNRYLFTNLNQCSFEWQLVSFPRPADKIITVKVQNTGRPEVMSVAPGEQGFLEIKLPASWFNSDALYLTAYDPYHREIFKWTWAIKSPVEINDQLLKQEASSDIDIHEDEHHLEVKQGGVTIFFDKATGYLSKINKEKSVISLSGGPTPAGLKITMKEFRHYTAGEQVIVEPVYQRDTVLIKWIFTPGKCVKLEYQYFQSAESDYAGITFNYPEEKITAMKWMGRGPYRVWKNRLKGLQFSVWEKEYNNTITGESWKYPEFKGYHADIYWVRIENSESSFTIYSGDENLFFQMLKPVKPKGAYNDNVSPPFPDANIGFMNAISPIGTKFQAAALLGPESQKNIKRSSPVKGNLWFDFR